MRGRRGRVVNEAEERPNDLEESLMERKEFEEKTENQLRDHEERH